MPGPEGAILRCGDSGEGVPSAASFRTRFRRHTIQPGSRSQTSADPALAIIRRSSDVTPAFILHPGLDLRGPIEPGDPILQGTVATSSRKAPFQFSGEQCRPRWSILSIRRGSGQMWRHNRMAGRWIRLTGQGADTIIVDPRSAFRRSVHMLPPGCGGAGRGGLSGRLGGQSQQRINGVLGPE